MKKNENDDSKTSKTKAKPSKVKATVTSPKTKSVSSIQATNKNPNYVVTTELDERTGLSIESLKAGFVDHLFYDLGTYIGRANLNDYYIGLSLTIRDRLLRRFLSTQKTYLNKDSRILGYLSAEYLPGTHLGQNVINLDLIQEMQEVSKISNYSLDQLIEHEPEPGLGNGGLGRLASCYIESLATLNYPAIGYGIRYEYGIFRQLIQKGCQKEIADRWLHSGNPWEIRRPKQSSIIKFGGYTQSYTDKNGKYRVEWVPSYQVTAMPYDTPIPGYKTNMCNVLRLWKAEAIQDFSFEVFNSGNYFEAVHDKILSETISKILYPNDAIFEGKQLRLAQQYFFVSASIQNMIDLHFRRGDKIHNFHKKFAIQLNDTHPSIAVVELMRLLIDVHDLSYEEAWAITTKSVNYTNHTLMTEALEKWPISLFKRTLPRHLELIYEINQRHLDKVRSSNKYDDDFISRVSLIDETGERYVKMANLAVIGAQYINGVAKLHSQLLKSHLFNDFYILNPEKFTNVTNGITPRRWLKNANPNLANLLDEYINTNWLNDLNQIKTIEKLAYNKDFQKNWLKVKKQNKLNLANFIEASQGLTINPDSLFDCQVKRIHEYKRQHLNVLHIISLYNKIKNNFNTNITPRTFIFSGKAAPAYYMAKQIIQLINAVANTINNDPNVNEILKVVFLPNFSVKLGQKIYPAADLSEQISLAGTEASGTGNMKFSLNGALTIGTLDGANIEIMDYVGKDNLYIFGMTETMVQESKNNGYNPHSFYESNPVLRQAIDSISNGVFSDGDKHIFNDIVNNLLYSDPFMVLEDFDSYINTQEKISTDYLNSQEWVAKSIINVANMGYFSSDRSINEYCKNIWQLKPIQVDLEDAIQARYHLIHHD